MASPKRKNPKSTAISYYDSGSDTYPDVASATPLPVTITSGSSSGTEYTEDAAAAANPAGGALIVVRQDTPGTLVSADGDNVAVRGTNYGAAYVQVVSSTGSFVDTFGGGTQYTEDAAAAADPVGTAMIMVRKDTLAGITSADGDNVAARGTDKGELYVKHVDSIPVTDNGGSLTIDNATLSVVGGGTEATALRVTVASDSTGVISVDDNGSSLTIDNSTLAVVGGGTEATAMRVTIASDSTGVLSIDDNGGTLTVDNAALSVVGGGVEASALRVTIANDSTGVVSVDDNGGSLTVDGTVAATQSGTWTEANSAAIAASLSVLDDWDETNRAAVNLIAGQAGIDGGSGVVGLNTVRVTLATDVALPAGTNAIGKLAANSGVDIGDVDITSIAAGTNTIGATVPVASASATGLSVSKTDAQTATVTAVKAGSGRVYGYHIFNPNVADTYLHFYDIASGSVTVGTSTRTRTLWIPAGGAIDTVFTVPLTFGTAISTAATTTITGSTAPQTGLLVDIDYI